MIVASVALALAALPALLFLVNLRLYRTPAIVGGPTVREGATEAPGATEALPHGRAYEHFGALPTVSILIPARNEAAGIAAAVEAALASRGVTLEVVVLDDHSTDATADLVRAIAARDPRVRLESAPQLPPGWCGKQHACHVLGGLARHPLLLFVDADVRLEPDGVARLAGFLQSSGADLVSGIPRQHTGTLLEKLLIPLIHFVLLGFLPIARMRSDPMPALGAGCGQLFLARAEAYHAMGGHAAIRTTLHDGVKLPRAFRAAGKKTDLCDATAVASCRMYHGAGAVWSGLAKNATEGLASPGLIVPATLLLGGGQIMPFVLLACAAWLSPLTLTLASLAAILAYLPRVAGVVRFRQSVVGAVLHPLGVTLLLATQWYALGRSVLGRRATWKGRSY